MKIIQIASGIHGVRQLAAARADIELRKKGYLPKSEFRNPYYRNRKGGWTDEEYDEAQAMRIAGKTNDQIAAALSRTTKAINQQLGYVSTKRPNYAVTSLRPFVRQSADGLRTA